MSLVSPEKIKQIVAISKNIDDNVISPFISLAETKYIKPVLGQLLYPDIVSKFNSQTLNDIETQLVGLLQIPHAFYVIENALPMMTYTITEKGLQSQIGVNSDTVDNKSQSINLSYMRNELKSNAEFFLNEVVTFLDTNKDSFPLYTQSGNLADTVSPVGCDIAFYPVSVTNTRSYFL